MTRPFPRRLQGLCLVAVALGGCAAATTPAAEPSPRPIAAQATAKRSAPPTEKVPPATIPPIPDGVYRTDIPQGGVSTLTIRSGTYNLACLPVPGNDCGGTPPNQRQHVDVGALRGDASTVWFIPNPELKAKLTGCNPALGQLSAGCGPSGAYRFFWKLSPKGLSVRDFFGLGDQAGQAAGYVFFTFQPWRKIA